MLNQKNCTIIGLDLDLTLVDSTKAIIFAANSALKLHGYNPNSEKIESMIGIPIRNIFHSLAADPDVDILFETYQNVYRKEAYKLSVPMPGAVSFLNYINDKDLVSIVITAKTAELAKLQLQFLEMRVSHIVGSSFQNGKTEALIRNNCDIYLGDHIEDYKSARGAGVPFIGIGKYWKNLIANADETFMSVSSLEDLLEIL